MSCRRVAACLLVCLALAGHRRLGLAQAPLSEPPAAIDVQSYQTRLRLDAQASEISATETISFVVTVAASRVVEFDAGEITVDRVVDAAGRALVFAREGRRVRVTLASLPASGEPITLEMRYRAGPSNGLRRLEHGDGFYTSFSTSRWMVSRDEPSERATVRLWLDVPDSWKVTASGAFVARRAAGPGRAIEEWFERRPIPGYIAGFAAGTFREARSDADGVRFRALSAEHTVDELARVLADAAPMARFFAERAGVAYGLPEYTQVVAGGGIGQEASGFAVLPTDYARAVLDGRRSSLAAHELAHQWWGNQVTCLDWRHFWLNEGLTTFMTAAWIEARDGRAAYVREVASMRERYLAVRGAGHDKALLFPEWRAPSADDRTIVYQKGGYVVHLLRQALGDPAFWAGIRRFSQRGGTSVVSADFQADMEAASGRDLRAFFNEWVFASAAP